MISDFWIPQYIKRMTKECNQLYNKNRVGLLLLSGHRIGKQTERVENSLFIHTGLSVWVSIKTFSLFFESLHKLWIKITLRPHQTTFLPTSASPCRLKASQFLKIWLPEHEERDDHFEVRSQHGRLPAASFRWSSMKTDLHLQLSLMTSPFSGWSVWVCMCVTSSRGRKRAGGVRSVLD